MSETFFIEQDIERLKRQGKNINSFLATPSKNLFDKNKALYDTCLSWSNGTIWASPGLIVSDYINITPLTKYALSGTQQQLAYYDINKKYISGVPYPNDTAGLLTSPSNAYYVRLLIETSQVDRVQWEASIIRTPYESYGLKLNSNSFSTFSSDTIQKIQGIKPTNIKTIKPDGTGDYLSPKLANDAIVDARINNVYELIIYPGVYTDVKWTLKSYINLTGINKKTCILKGELPVTSSDSTMTYTSTLVVDGTNTFRNLTITAKNMRYPIHPETNGLKPDQTVKCYNCDFIHYGNQDVKAYRTANSLSNAGLWASTTAWGHGASSGEYQYFENCLFQSDTTAWYIHNNGNFTNPVINELKNCRMVCPQGSAIRIENMGSGTEDRTIFNNCEITGKILYNDYPWLPTDMPSQYSNHSDIAIEGCGNTSVPFSNSLRGKAIKIISNSITDNSKVTVSGAGATAMFGTTTSFIGNGGLKGNVLGSLDISGIWVSVNNGTIVDNTLGKRLGDCTVINKELIITIDANTPISIIFNLDYTAQTNTQILTIINTALLSQGVASEYTVNDYKPNFLDEFKTLYNSSLVGIPKGSAVVYTDFANVRLMTSTDVLEDFAGFALENINPRSFGKVKIKGYLKNTDLIFDGSSTTAYGTSFGISTTIAGALKVGLTPTIVKGKLTDYIGFNIK